VESVCGQGGGGIVANAATIRLNRFLLRKRRWMDSSAFGECVHGGGCGALEAKI
jgi:hypothetical protein